MDQTLSKIVGERIRTVRSEKGLTQAEVAKKTDFTAASISNIENGAQSIQLIDLYKIAELLEKEVTYFLPSLKELKNALPSIEKEKKKHSPQEVEFIDLLRKQQIHKED